MIKINDLVYLRLLNKTVTGMLIDWKLIF